MDSGFETVMLAVVKAIKNAGYDPYEQLYGYVATGKEEYITRNGNARELIKQLDKDQVKEFVEKMAK